MCPRPGCKSREPSVPPPQKKTLPLRLALLGFQRKGQLLEACHYRLIPQPEFGGLTHIKVLHLRCLPDSMFDSQLVKASGGPSKREVWGPA